MTDVDGIRQVLTTVDLIESEYHASNQAVGELRGQADAALASVRDRLARGTAHVPFPLPPGRPGWDASAFSTPPVQPVTLPQPQVLQRAWALQVKLKEARDHPFPKRLMFMRVLYGDDLDHAMKNPRYARRQYQNADNAQLETAYTELLRRVEPKVNATLVELEKWKRTRFLYRVNFWEYRPAAHLPPELVNELVILGDLSLELSDRWKRSQEESSKLATEAKRLDRETAFLTEARKRLSEARVRIDEQARLKEEHARGVAELRLWAKEEDFRIRRQLDAAVKAAKDKQSRARAEARKALEDIVTTGGISARAWDDPQWQAATSPEQAGGDIRIGQFVIDLPAPADDLEAVAALRFPFEAGLFIDGAADNHRLMVDLARSACLRLLAAVPAGKLQFTFLDPVAYGQSVADFQHLADFDKQLVGIKPVTSGREIEERLAGLSAHMETVISDYLRGQFATIDEYNTVAGEVAEPYRVLVVFDYPAGFSDAAAQRLLSLAENGPRCGIHVIMVNDRSRAQPRDLPLDRLRLGQHQITVTGTPAEPRITLHTAGASGSIQREVVPDAAPSIEFDRDGAPQSAAAELLVKVGTLTRDAGNAPVTLPRLLPVLNQVIASGRSTGLPPVSPPVAISEADPSTWWRGSTADNAVAPLGLSGARDVAAMFFSSTDVAGGAIMVGLPSSGKTTSLHSAILTMCMLYGPEELELYLIDAKHGVEFKVYERLPHARMVSINSDRELAVAVLKSLDREIQRRAGLMKSRAAGRANITEYRQVTGERMARIVLIMDEFHEIFEEDDHLGREAFQAFSNLVRQGRFAGIHVVVASQTLSSMPALDRPTLQLLPQRVAFMCNETDADIVMGDANPGARLLTRQGRGLFNPVRGEVSHNRPFQGLYIPPTDRDDLIGALAATAAGAGWDRLPRVFDGDVAAPRPVDTAARQGATRLRIPVGEPFTLDLAVSLELRRTRTANVILLGDMDDDTLDPAIRGALHSCVLAALTAGSGVSVIDYIGDERVADGLTMMNIARLAGLPYSRSKGAAQILGGLTRLVSERLAAEDYTGQGHVLVIFGLQCALSLRPVDPYQLDDPETTSDAATLTRLLQDGPEVGVHVIIACDGVKAVERRLGRDVLEEFAFRVAGSAAGAADLSYAAETFGDIPGLRHSQLLVGDQSANRTSRVRGYPLLTQAGIPTGGIAHE